MKKKKEELTRKFLGKTDNFEDKKDRHFNDRMLRAYLKGKEIFTFNNDTHKVEFSYE